MPSAWAILVCLFCLLSSSFADDTGISTPEPDETHPFASVTTSDITRALYRPEEGLQIIRFKAVRRSPNPVPSEISVPKYLDARFRDGEFLILYTDAERKEGGPKNYFTKQELGEVRQRQFEQQYQRVFGPKRSSFVSPRLILPPPNVNTVPKADPSAKWNLTRVIEASRKEDKTFQLMVLLETRLKTRLVFDDSIVHVDFDSFGKLLKIGGFVGFTEDTYRIEWDRGSLGKSEDGRRVVSGLESALGSIFSGILSDKALAISK